MSEQYGEYELLRLIATGGMAEIYLARHGGVAGLSRMVVVKRMLPQLAVRPDFVRMFLDEARLAAKLNHPNIVQVFNLGEVDQSYYIAMEFVDGPHLGSLFAHSLRQRSPLPVELCVQVVARAADGLHYAHEVIDPATGSALDIVHRDISPQNLLVSRIGDVKVTDFGVAKAATQQTKTRTGIIKGKVAYMSPEQCLGEAVDRRTDVFALGIVLYELLTRRRLFREKSDLLIMQKITGSDVPPPSSVNKEIDAELDAICAKALARKREERFSSAAELSEALDAWMITNSRGDARIQLQRWFEQHALELVVHTRDELSNPEQLTTRTRTAPTTDPGEATSATPSLNSAETAMSRLAQQAQQAQRDEEARHNEEARAEPTLVHAGYRTESSGPDDPTAEPSIPGVTAEGAPEELQTLRMARAELVDHEPPPTMVSQAVVTRPRASRLPLAAALGALTLLAAVAIAVAMGADQRSGSALVKDAGPAVVGTVSDDAAATAATAATAASAQVHVESEPPGASILIDDRRVVGKAPLSFQHAAGPIKVAAQFSDQPPVPIEVTLRPGEVRNIRLLAKVPLKVTSGPSRAKVRVGSVLKGETPYFEAALITPEKDVKVRVELEGHEPFERVLRAKPGTPLIVNATLAASATRKRLTDAPKARPAEPGFLNMRSTPWVNVRVVGAGSLGATIFNNQKIPSGRQVLQLTNPELGISDSLVVTVPEGKALSVTLEWEQKPGGGWRIKSRVIR